MRLFERWASGVDATSEDAGVDCCAHGDQSMHCHLPAF